MMSVLPRVMSGCAALLKLGSGAKDHGLFYHPKAVGMPGAWATPRGHADI